MSHSVSEKQLHANRLNAQKSTGPRSPQGKARSAQNSRKHGFTASTFAVVRLEDLEEIAHLKDDLVALYQPVNSQELFALERISLTQQALLRAARLESGLFTSCLNESLDSSAQPIVPMSQELAGDGDIEITREQNRNYALAEGFHRMAQQSNSWSLLLRYQAQAERHYRRAIEEFERLKALRPGLTEEPPDELPGELPDEPISGAQPEPNKSTCTPSGTNSLAPENPASEPAPAARVGQLSRPVDALSVTCRKREIHTRLRRVSGTLFQSRCQLGHVTYRRALPVRGRSQQAWHRVHGRFS
jgi:hypothetical protein